MANKIPADITPGDANRGSVVHASDASLSDLSRSHTEEDISRLQSAINDYSSSLTYKVGDVVLEADDVYRCINDVNIPEAFNPANWEITDIAQTPWESDIDGAGFDLNNAININLNAPSQTSLTMFQNDATAVPNFSIGQLNYNARRGGGGNVTYARMTSVVSDNSNGTANSQLQIQNRISDSLTVMMEFSPTSSLGNIRVYSPLNIHQTNLTFDDTLSVPSNTTTAIYRNTGLIFNVQGIGNPHSFTINGTEQLNISSTAINSPTSPFQEAGVSISPIGDHDIWFDASAAVPVSSGAVASRFSGTGDNQKGFSYIPYVSASDTFSVIKFTFPRNYNNGPLTAVFKWTTQVEGAGDVVWGIAGVAIPDGGDYTAVATDYGTEVTVTDTQTTINQEQITSRTTNISLNGTIAAGNSIYLRIRRVGTSGADTFTEDAQLLGVFLEFTTSEATST